MTDRSQRSPLPGSCKEFPTVFVPFASISLYLRGVNVEVQAVLGSHYVREYHVVGVAFRTLLRGVSYPVPSLGKLWGLAKEKSTIIRAMVVNSARIVKVTFVK